MIKIKISDVAALKAEYLTLIKHLVINDLKLLRLSLEHLLDYTSIKMDDIVSVKTITKDLANIIRKPKLPNKTFNKAVYIIGVEDYLIGAETIYKVDFDELYNIVDSLIDQTNGHLESLLVGDPEKLKETSDNLLNHYKLGNQQELDILKYGINYTGDIGKVVRRFFYDKSFTTFCPYCNQGLALHTENIQTGKTADQFHLDHFFDKDNNPLLALSLFNLIPSDTTCNVTNKLTTPFTDKFHLNPYISGYKQDMIFKPIYNPLDKEITEIELNITVLRNSPRHLQLIGDKDKLNEQPEHGNLNVFQIYTKYNRDDVKERSSHILRNMYNAAINKESLTELLKDTGMANSYENFKKWYEGTVYTRFQEKEFDKHPYSKLNRDIIDFVYATYPQDFNNEVRKILRDSYLPDQGGE